MGKGMKRRTFLKASTAFLAAPSAFFGAKTVVPKTYTVDLKSQKFFRGHRVRIASEMPQYMSHFPCGGEAIVVGSYSDIYGGNDINSYSLLLIEPYGGMCSWYEEGQLTLVSTDRDKGEGLLQLYKE